MTRKRYIKLLMAMGVPRNAATRSANSARKHAVPYETCLEMQKTIRKTIANRFADELGRMILHGTGIHPTGMAMDFLPRLRMDTKPLPNAPVIVVQSPYNIDTRIFDWPPRPQPAAGCLYAIDTTPTEETGEQWPKENPHAIEILDALRYATEAMYNRQRGVLGR